tara:strand:- start:344 stop:703 length:360 start_codon:yes stop_codon:yes gene_type:complete
MEQYLQKRLREQRRMLPQAAPRSEHERYYDCATEPSKQQESSLQLVRHNAMKCWEGYERVPGTKPGADGSCRKKGSGKKKKKSKDKSAKKEGDKSSSSSSSDDEDGKPKKQKKEKGSSS